MFSISIRKVMMSIMVSILSIVGCKANPGNYVLKFGVSKDDVCSDCHRTFSQRNADIFHFQYAENSMLFAPNYDIFIYPKDIKVTEDTKPLCCLFNLGGLLIKYSDNGYWDARPQAFIDLDESTQRYRCFECMVSHAEKGGHLEPIKSFSCSVATVEQRQNILRTLFFCCNNSGGVLGEASMLSAVGNCPSIGLTKCLVCTSQDCCIVRDGRSKCQVCSKTEGEKFVCPCCLRVVAHIKCLIDNKFKCNFCKNGNGSARDIRPRMFVIPVRK